MKRIVIILLLFTLCVTGCAVRGTESSCDEVLDKTIAPDNNSEASLESETSENTWDESSDITSSESNEVSATSDESTFYDEHLFSDENSQPGNNGYKCKLIVNGKDITEGSGVKMYSDRAELPFVAIMEALGREFEWENDKKAEIKNDVFVLRVDTGELLLQGLASSPNFFDVFDDKPLEYTAMDKEILIDETNAGAFFSEEGILLEINYEEMVIRISDDNNDYECTLIINGKNVSEGSRAVLRKDDGHYFLLPIVEILGELGAEFEWESDTIANFIFREQEFVLDISGHQVYLTATDEQLIGIVVGGTAKFKEMKQELLMDNILAKGFFESIGVTMNYDYDSRVVTIALSEDILK